MLVVTLILFDRLNYDHDKVPDIFIHMNLWSIQT